MGKILTIEEIRKGVEEFAPKHGISKVFLFGSYATGDQTPESDVDLLVEFENPQDASLFTIIGFKHDLYDTIKKRVEIVEAPVPTNSFLKITKEVPLYG